MRALLAELKWEGREEWLNRRNDESIRLYKEVVSIVELDGSVVEEFGVGLHGAVGIPEISRYVKYAEFLRNNKHDNLKEYFENCPKLEANDVNWQEDIDWNSEDEDFIIPPQPRSSDSLPSISERLDKEGKEGKEGKEKEFKEVRDVKTMTILRSPNSMHSLHSLPS